MVFFIILILLHSWKDIINMFLTLYFFFRYVHKIILNGKKLFHNDWRTVVNNIFKTNNSIYLYDFWFINLKKTFFWNVRKHTLLKLRRRFSNCILITINLCEDDQNDFIFISYIYIYLSFIHSCSFNRHCKSSKSNLKSKIHL